MSCQNISANADRTCDDFSPMAFGEWIIELTRENELTDAQALEVLVYALVNRYMYDLYCGERSDVEFISDLVKEEATKVAEKMDDLFDDDISPIDILMGDEDNTPTIEGCCMLEYDREKELSILLQDFVEDVECLRESDCNESDFHDHCEAIIIDLRCMGWSRKEIRRFRYFVSEIVDGSYDGMTMVEMDALIRYVVCFRDIPLSGEFVSDEDDNWYRGEDEGDIEEGE